MGLFFIRGIFSTTTLQIVFWTDPLIGVFDKATMAGGIVTFLGNKNAAHVFYFGSLSEYQNRRPLNLGVLKLISFAAEKGARFVNFGISTEEGGSIINHGLFRFKESFGGYGTMRTFWEKDLQEEST